LDGDGDADVLVDDGYWENSGGGILTTFRAGWSGRPMLTQDVDGDGDLDVLAQTSAGVLTLARDAGVGYASELLAASSVDGTPSLGDLDGDGDLDLAVGTNSGGFAVLLLENVAGSFAAPLRLDLSQESHHRIALDDFDGDGRVDVLAMPARFAAIEWTLWPQSSTSWTFEPALEFLGGATQKVADFDADGDLDGIGGRLTRSRRFEGAANGRIRQEGAGDPQAEPASPLLGARGPLRPGSTGARLLLRRARGGATGLLLLSSRALVNGPDGKARRLPPYGATLPLVLSGTPGASGEGSFTLPLGPATLALAGQRIWLQALVRDPVAPPSQAAISNALELTFGL
jgi:hypothetical protein